MQRHFFLIDPLEQLTIKKDSTLLLALEAKSLGHEAYILFARDLALHNKSEHVAFNVSTFSGKTSDHEVKSFELGKKNEVKLEKGDVLHMRLEPPVDGKYMRALWQLQAVEKRGVRVVNAPTGLLKYNEKMLAFDDSSAHDTYIGYGPLSEEAFPGVHDFIIKPLDLFQGIGVAKVKRKELSTQLRRKTDEFQGPAVVQPFDSQVETGEVRAVYIGGKELASITKTPPKDSFLANIAQGASFAKCELTNSQRISCDQMAKKLLEEGISWVAFDMLGDHLSEANITCPGLLVEVSKAHDENFSRIILERL